MGRRQTRFPVFAVVIGNASVILIRNGSMIVRIKGSSQTRKTTAARGARIRCGQLFLNAVVLARR